MFMVNNQQLLLRYEIKKINANEKNKLVLLT